MTAPIVLLFIGSVFIFLLNRYRKYCYWSEFTKLYGYIRITEDCEHSAEEKSMYWDLFERKIGEQRINFLVFGRPRLVDLPEELQPKAKIFDFQKSKETKKTEEK